MTTPSSSTAVSAARPAPEPSAPDHVRMGVGARLTLHPATDDVVTVVLSALSAARAAAPAVTVRTDDVSTLLRGSEHDVVAFVAAGLEHAARITSTGHVVATLALSRGCPGEVGCELPQGALPEVAPVALTQTGLRASAHWALYPLGTEDAMGPILAAIGTAQRRGTYGGAESFATRLDGDLAEVLATVVDTWTGVGRDVAHVVAHATVSVGSPSSDR